MNPDAAFEHLNHLPEVTVPFEHPEWQRYAACKGVDPDLFFHPRGTDEREMSVAKRICAHCAVRAECLAYALDNGERWGVWGGLSANERRRMKRAKRGGR